MSIPASTIVSVVPSVLTAGGNPLALNGLMLSQNPVLPLGAPVSFSSLASVQSYFGQYSWTGTATCSANTLTVVSTTSGTLAVGQMLQSAQVSGVTGVPPGTYITALVGSTATISGPGYTQATAAAVYSNCLESQFASVYFNGFTGSTLKPTALLFSRMPSYAIPSFFRGAAVPGLTLAQCTAVTTGTLTMTLNGSAVSIATLNLSTAIAISGTGTTVCSLLAAALITGGAPAGTTVWFNTTTSQFQINCGATGNAGSTTACGGTSAGVALLGLTSGTISLGSATVAAGTFMSSLVLFTTNWASFTTCYEPITTDKQLLCTWTGGTGGQYVYVPFNTDTTITSSNASTTCMSYYCSKNSLAGTFEVFTNPTYDPAGLAAAFVLGFIASINYNATNGRAAISFKSGTGTAASIQDPTSYANALANNVNFFGSWATANNVFPPMFYNGEVSGPYVWLDSYVNAIWLNNALQLQLMNMFTVMNSIPYNNAGYAMIKAACTGVLNQAITNGVINTGVALTATQASAVDTAAGVIIDPVLATTGYYLQVGVPAPTATQRANRTSPTCTLWYMDGGSVNQLNLASINIQ